MGGERNPTLGPIALSVLVPTSLWPPRSAPQTVQAGSLIR